MPYRWTDPETITLWPHRSLGPRGFVWTIGLLSTGLGLPLLGLLGSKVLWGILATVSATVMLLWLALKRNLADRAIIETLRLRPDLWTLTHRAGAEQVWAANPHWIRLTLHETSGPVPAYLTLTGGGREVEIGAFLTEEERRALRHDLARRLQDLRPA
jgi:uncharacterized membrane protein